MMGMQRVVCPSPQSSGEIKICLDCADVNNPYFYKSNYDQEKIDANDHRCYFSIYVWVGGTKL